MRPDDVASAEVDLREVLREHAEHLGELFQEWESERICNQVLVASEN